MVWQMGSHVGNGLAVPRLYQVNVGIKRTVYGLFHMNMEELETA
jgi:hypothetical protein